MAEETNQPEASQPSAEEQKPSPASQEAKLKSEKPAAGAGAAKPKKEKPPAVEDKPFTEFIEQHFNPTLKQALTAQGIDDVELNLSKQSLPIATANEQCWQVSGNWQNGQRQFKIYFLDEDISGPKAFSYATSGGKPSTLESFMIDERKITLDLMVLYTLQRLNGQKWLSRN
ncbi:DUF2996 domain-containing protein [Stanieria cyanosphaera]|nr:DUF2996 domain-containing protein [Stanieria cyanosphaera]